MNTKIILDYLSELEKNNNREWFADHKEERIIAVNEFEKLIQELILKIGEFDHSILFNEAKDLTFKLVRDTRFSKDKSPYNPVFRAHISSKGKLPIPVGYFLFIKPGNKSFLGGGLFADMFSSATTMIRNHISENPKELYKIINDASFKENFTVEGTKLKNVPKGYDSDCLMAEYLKHKSYYLEYAVNDECILDASAFIDMAAEKFRLMRPFNTYLNHALKDFEMPKR